MASPLAGGYGADADPTGGVDLSFVGQPGALAPDPGAAPVPVPANGSGVAGPSTDLSHLAIVVVDADQNVRTQLAAQLGAHAVAVASVAGAAEHLNGRPVVIVQSDAFNRSSIATVVCVPLTSNQKWAGAPGNVKLTERETSLEKDSVANVSQVTALDRIMLDEHVGKIPRRKLDLIFAGIDIVLGR